MRLIDADGLIKKAYRSEMWNRSTQAFDLFVVDAEDVEDAPTIDAVEVVRCRDCKYSYGLVNTGSLYCEVNSGFAFSTRCDGFCSRGVKMDAEVEG